MSERTAVLRQLALPLSGLVLSLIDTGNGGVWELTRSQRPHVMLHIAATGANLLHAAYSIPGHWQDTDLAVGHIPAGHVPPASIRFTTAHLRWRREATATPVVASDTLWVAEVAGDYDLVVLPAEGDEPQHVVRLVRLA